MRLQTASKQSSVASYEGAFTEDQRRAMVSELAACQLVQRTYGKQAAELPAVVKVFMSDLAEYSPEDVIAAIAKWRLTKPEFPTPADIRKLLNPEPVFDYAVYSRLVAKAKADGASMSDREWRYIREYEENAMKGM